LASASRNTVAPATGASWKSLNPLSSASSNTAPAMSVPVTDDDCVVTPPSPSSTVTVSGKVARVA
jgi:hypothetical protein